MQDNKETQGFDLDDILNEFHDLPQENSELPEEELGALPGDLADLLGDWDGESGEAVPVVETPEAVSMDSDRMQELMAQLEPETPAEAPVSMDTGRMNALIDEILEQEKAENPVLTDATVRVDQLAGQFSGEEKQPSSEATLRMEPLIPENEQTQQEAEQEEEPAILYNPRTRLRELKRKLVAGPEKRYYELSEMGVGRLQVSVLLNLALVALCVLTTTLFSLNLIPGNRLRFVIFSQVLSMLLSAFLGSGQMIDGVADLFKGRFTINTMLPITFAACCADAVFCLSELRVPCCAAFSLEVTMALWARYQRHSTETAQMDTLRKAVRLNAMVKEPDYYDGKPGFLRRDGELEEFMDVYSRASGPEKVQGIYCLLSLLLCGGIAGYTGMTHGVSMALQIFSASLLVAVPASFFICLTRPAALLERRLHMVGTVLCGWRGVKQLCGKAAFPLQDEDLFPANTTKLNGVKFYGDRDPDEVVSYTTSLIIAAGGGLVTVFRQMLESRSGLEYDVANFRDYGSGGIGGEVCGEPVLLGTLDFLQDMGVEIPEGTMVSQAVYAAIDGQLCAVFAISYAKMRSAAAGIISLCGSRKVTPVLTGRDFMLTPGLLRAKFNVNTRRIAFPDQEYRAALSVYAEDDQTPALALATRNDLVSYAYAVSGARALRTASRLGVAIHLVGGILGLLIMAVLAFLGNTELLTPIHILLYQLVWMVPGLLITEWTRTV